MKLQEAAVLTKRHSRSQQGNSLALRGFRPVSSNFYLLMNVIILAAVTRRVWHSAHIEQGQAALEVAGKPIIERILIIRPVPAYNDLCRDKQ